METQAIEFHTDHKAGDDNVRPFGLDLHNPVFFISGILVALFVLVTAMFTEQAGEFFAWLRPASTNSFDWLLVISGNIFIIFCIGVALSPFGKMRIGGDDAKPDFGYPAWLAMLFSAGMGIGLMYFGVSEPMSHYAASLAENAGTAESWAPLGGAPGDQEAAARLGLAASIFHWGLHPWAMYAIVGLALAIFCFNCKLPLSIRSTFYPLLGERVWGWPGHCIDTLAVFATLFGLATSLGLGASQSIAGLNDLFGVPNTTTSQVILIALITCCAMISVVLGLHGGIKRLSAINMVLAFVLLVFVIVTSSPLAVAKGLGENLSAYMSELLPLSNFIGREDTNFYQDWTAFYWAWWISWSPFVGMFIARISKGRTIREFIFCVLVVPSIVSLVWMTAFGGTAIDQVINGNPRLVEAENSLKLFVMLSELPLAALTMPLTIVLVIVFFVTSSDSGSLVVDTITAGGKLDAPVSQRVFWAIFEGLVAIILLIAGGLTALQAGAVSTGIPFAVVLLAMCVSIVMGLRSIKRLQPAASASSA